MPRQLSFDLPAKQALGRDDFFVSPANALAVAMIEQPAAWAGGKLVLSGPAGSGKTHLAHVWAAAQNAAIRAAANLAEGDIPALATGNVVVEDVPAIAADRPAQEALFHLHNMCLAGGHRVLLTGRGAPNCWGLSLPDLQSRIDATQLATLNEPDDALLGAVLAKLFADRQIVPRPDVIPYLVARMDRSFAAASDIVAQLDQAALSEKRALSRVLAARLLGAEPSGG